MGAVTVRDGNPLQVGDALAELVNRLEHEPGVALEQGVDERELVAGLDEERAHTPTGAVAEPVDSRCQHRSLSHQRTGALPGRERVRHARERRLELGEVARSSTVLIVLSSIQSRPSGV